MAEQLGSNGYVECRNVQCDREVRPSDHPTAHPRYCCHACGLAHLGGYLIEAGPLTHSDECNQRQARHERQAQASWGDETIAAVAELETTEPSGPSPDCPHGFNLRLEFCERCEPQLVQPPRSLSF